MDFLRSHHHCTSACRHCLYRSSPRWPKEFIPNETARKNLEVIHRLGCRMIHVGGDESLLGPECVVSVLRIAREVGIDVEYVETHASGYRDPPSACALLEKLAAEGLSTLLVSISPFHNEHIPFNKIKGVIEACEQVGISIFPWIAEFLPDLRAWDPSRSHTLEEYEKHFGDGYIAGLPRRYWINPGGQALDTFGKFGPRRFGEEIISGEGGGCRELAEVSHFHMDLFGNYGSFSN